MEGAVNKAAMTRYGKTRRIVGIAGIVGLLSIGAKGGDGA